LKQSADRILKSKIRDQRIQQARVRRYFQQHCLDQRRRLLKKRTNEELILKQAYKDSIRIQRERLHEMKKYKQEYNGLFLARYRNQLESLENHYRQRLTMFKEIQQTQFATQRAQDRENKLELSKQRLQLRHQLESDIKQLQDQLNQNDDYVHYRQLDLERLKENLVQARITSKV
jgi:oligoribonuclease (3'-5' exoribonuclease)